MSWPSVVVTPTIFSFSGSFTSDGSRRTVIVTLQSVKGISRVKTRETIKRRQAFALKLRGRHFAKRRLTCICSSDCGFGNRTTTDRIPRWLNHVGSHRFSKANGGKGYRLKRESFTYKGLTHWRLLAERFKNEANHVLNLARITGIRRSFRDHRAQQGAQAAAQSVNSRFDRSLAHFQRGGHYFVRPGVGVSEEAPQKLKETRFAHSRIFLAQPSDRSMKGCQRPLSFE